jgi:hypothetical protein
MNADFVLVRGVCEQLPQLRLDSILLDPQLGKFSVGAEPGQFPGTPEQWQSISALVLLGGPNTMIPPDAMAGLQAAIQTGLRVLVIASDALPGLNPASEQSLPPVSEPAGGWLPALGVPHHVLAASSPAQPRDDLWLPFYALGRDEAESRERWARLPAPWWRVVPRPAGTPLSTGGEYADFQLVPQGRGGILHVGLTAFAALRANGTGWSPAWSRPRRGHGRRARRVRSSFPRSPWRVGNNWPRSVVRRPAM